MGIDTHHHHHRLRTSLSQIPGKPASVKYVGCSMQYLKMSKAPKLQAALGSDPAMGRDPKDTRKLYHRRKLHMALYLGIPGEEWGYSNVHLMMCKVTKCLVVGLVTVLAGLEAAMVVRVCHQGNKVSKHKSFLADRPGGHLHRHRRSCRRLDILNG